MTDRAELAKELLADATALEVLGVTLEEDAHYEKIAGRIRQAAAALSAGEGGAIPADGWIFFHGRSEGCPLENRDELIFVLYRDGSIVGPRRAQRFLWLHQDEAGEGNDVVAYAKAPAPQAPSEEGNTNPQPRKDGEAKHRMEDTISFGPGFCSRCGSADPDELSKPCPATSDGKVYAAASAAAVPAGASEDGLREIYREAVRARNPNGLQLAPSLTATEDTAISAIRTALRRLSPTADLQKEPTLRYLLKGSSFEILEGDICLGYVDREELARRICNLPSSSTADLLKAAKEYWKVAWQWMDKNSGNPRQIDLEAIRTRAEKAKHGPWSSAAQVGEPGRCLMAQVFDENGHALADIEPTLIARLASDIAAHIAGMCPATTIAMCDEIERLRALSAPPARQGERSPLETRVCNLLYNVEQIPERHTVPELIRSLRDALGLKDGERP